MNRVGYVLATSFAAAGAAVASAVPMTPRFLWNASASAPLGLYELERPSDLKVGDLVAMMPDRPLADFMVGRGYIGRDMPLLKRIMALPGQDVCRTSRVIAVDGVPLGDALERDRRGRELPVWQGCRRLRDGDVFLMNPSARDSLDGRYFGPTAARSVIARATPVYTDEAGDGRFVWRAPTR